MPHYLDSGTKGLTVCPTCPKSPSARRLYEATPPSAQNPARYTVYADVELDGRWKDGIFYFDKEAVGQGGNFWIITKNVKCLGKIDSNVVKIN